MGEVVKDRRPRFEWTPQRLRTLKKLAGAGLSNREIGDSLGCGCCVAGYKIRQLKIKRPSPHRHRTAQQRRLVERKEDPEIAEAKRVIRAQGFEVLDCDGTAASGPKGHFVYGSSRQIIDRDQLLEKATIVANFSGGRQSPRVRSL